MSKIVDIVEFSQNKKPEIVNQGYEMVYREQVLVKYENFIQINWANLQHNKQKGYSLVHLEARKHLHKQKTPHP